MSFTCPNCQALYQLVKVEAGPETTFHDVACRACGASLPGREGNLVRKYFLLRNGGPTPTREASVGAITASMSDSRRLDNPLLRKTFGGLPPDAISNDEQPPAPVLAAYFSRPARMLDRDPGQSPR
jgi:hypothetical protein